ncbi:molybdenum cofactor synthesis 2 [Coprinopsis cinerea okayama7|uniref:Molybdopterin synthase catalytic subunit n=1 Tax=Coprinopsis cinerea (strain Okayama-7 / 130 / ATCC MYA-4618 / FGSC 9003) TaxID=240176 RepID=A8N1D2_COPC7|nr:molybdenum cofactor synthesis 2 [Coprinopsis cinerea okayama7\|eukprot:XP_001828681.1 molybdenum cofactor synthesis 2 [Coprinopsis cinerea okayama7\
MQGLLHSASTDARLELAEGICVLTYSKLIVEDITNIVRDDGAGAIAVFIGTTRNSFKGKVVTKLEYQAYSKLAIKTLAQILQDVQQLSQRSEHQPPSSDKPVTALIKCAVYHRLGTVPVGEPSIVIAVSSPHRKEAFRACEYILEEVKQKAQIWKREFYEGEDESTAVWKENV